MKRKFRSDKIILIGDTHSNTASHHILNVRIPDGSDVIHIGDHGLGFGNISYAIENALSWLDRINKLCQAIDVMYYIIRGNHDATYPKIWDSKWSNIVLIKDQEYVEFPNGKKAILVGGGISVDRCNRKQGVDYWYDEPTIPIDNVEKCDIMFSHDAPDYFNHPTNTLHVRFQWSIDKDPTLLSDCYTQRELMSSILEKSEAKTLVSGHFHNSKKEERNGVYYQCLDINEIFEFDANKEYKL